jgi:hypothetical protein
MNKDLYMIRKLAKMGGKPNLAIQRKSGDDLSESSEVSISSAISNSDKKISLI